MASNQTKRALTDEDLVKIIESHWDDGIGSDHGELSNDRENILDRYMGELYGNELQGESKVVSRDVFETVEWAMAALVRKFTSGERPVQFVANDPMDAEQAKIETESVHDDFWKDNDGFVVTYLTLKNLLLNPTGYLKVSRLEETKAHYETYRNLSLAEVDMVDQDPTVEILEQDSEYNEEFEQDLYTIRIKRVVEKGRNVVQVVPEDEVVVDGNWTELDLDDCPFVCHAPEKSHSELLEMGIDEDVLIRNYSADGDSTQTSEETNRREYSDETYSDDETHFALRKYRLYEAYMLADVDGDGIAERYIVQKIGNEVVMKEPTDFQGMISGASILLPHRHLGYSLAQSVMDLQKIRTTIWRQLLNNMYLVNNPKKKVTKGANLSDVLANRSNNVLRVTSPDDITFEQPVPMISQIAPLIELIDQEKEMRSGVTKHGTVPNPDMIRESAEGTFNNLIDRADQRLDLIARLFGETVFKKIFLKLHHLQLQYGEMKWLKHNGQFIQVDPSTWKRRDRVVVKVGLGFNSGHKKLAAASAIKADHDALMASPMGAFLIRPEHIYNGRKMWLNAMGEEDTENFYVNPMIEPPKPQEPQPDPNQMLIASNERIEGGKLQARVMELQMKQQLDQARMQAEFALKEREAMFKAQEMAWQREMAEYKWEMERNTAMSDDEIQRMKIKVDTLEAALQDAQNDEKLAVEKFKAQLQADTQIALKEMELAVKAEPAETESPDISYTGFQEALTKLSGAIDQIRSRG